MAYMFFLQRFEEKQLSVIEPKTCRPFNHQGWVLIDENSWGLSTKKTIQEPGSVTEVPENWIPLIELCEPFEGRFGLSDLDKKKFYVLFFLMHML